MSHNRSLAVVQLVLCCATLSDIIARDRSTKIHCGRKQTIIAQTNLVVTVQEFWVWPIATSLANVYEPIAFKFGVRGAPTLSWFRSDKRWRLYVVVRTIYIYIQLLWLSLFYYYFREITKSHQNPWPDSLHKAWRRGQDWCKELPFGVHYYNFEPVAVFYSNPPLR